MGNGQRGGLLVVAEHGLVKITPIY